MQKVEDKIVEDFKPFFDEMINELLKHYPEKGDTWKTCDELHLDIALKKAVLELDNKMVNIDHLIDIANLCSMMWLRRRGFVYHSLRDVN